MLTQRALWLGQAVVDQGSAVKPLSDQALVEALASTPKAVVKFYRPSCPYSQKFAPIYEAVAAQYPDVLFAAVNVDQDVQQAGANKVQMLPTVVFFVNGKAVGRIDGVQDQGDFLSEMGKAFSATPGAVQPAAQAAVPTSPRSGTLVAIEAPPSVLPYVLGGVAAAGVLGVAAYFLFIAK